MARRHFPTRLLQIRGERPFLSKKYDLEKHKNYKHLADFDKNNTFDVKKHLSTKLRLKPNDVYDVVEIDVST